MIISIIVIIVALVLFFVFPDLFAILDFIPRTIETIGFVAVGLFVVGSLIMSLFGKKKN